MVATSAFTFSASKVTAALVVALHSLIFGSNQELIMLKITSYYDQLDSQLQTVRYRQTYTDTNTYCINQ